ncbi:MULTISPECIES: peptide deformylase [unclassified Methylophaga]|jgi:peptide deformylase|uniref:peptide deformylase n=1 Tax=unclassified Methylophaga TaxID=2629249 RepID=UPI000C957E4B|nr:MULTISPECIES: peptide deformylase [unclassified Methylophaga]MAK66961.1 peptide deformylase [Methylophaga sp.]MAY17998.1 peptide deformylase [Methylophaga sp.]MBN47208.1 peptide deformylase [Methylophaga sp.]HAD32318.1 peptide deformylase [Methylophaga sp.]|tara:strand:+ start:1124 stop:1672 length:549 start_codon:yes stop_codon:yes gene_type:complete
MKTDFDILELGQSDLRRIAEPVTDIQSTVFQQKIDALIEFVKQRGGMGIAATQVGINQRFFIMSSHPNDRYPYAPDMPATSVINPEIVWHSDAMEKDWEGCLSVPGLRALVPRYQQIKVRYLLRNGELVETEYHDFMARLFQHELDHLDGKVFVDRVESSLDMMTESSWRSMLTQQSGDNDK